MSRDNLTSQCLTVTQYFRLSAFMMHELTRLDFLKQTKHKRRGNINYKSTNHRLKEEKDKKRKKKKEKRREGGEIEKKNKIHCFSSHRALENH